jgi:hypothetical protein
MPISSRMSRSGQRVSRTTAPATRTATISAATRTPPWCGRVADGDSIACLAARLDSVTAGHVITACDVRHPVRHRRPVRPAHRRAGTARRPSGARAASTDAQAVTSPRLLRPGGRCDLVRLCGRGLGRRLASIRARHHRVATLLLPEVELVQGCGPAFAAGVGVLLPPRGTAFAETALGCPDPGACCGHRRVVVGPFRGADRGPGGPEVVQQPGPDLLGELGIGRPPPPAVDDDPPTAGGTRRRHPRIVPSRGTGTQARDAGSCSSEVPEHSVGLPGLSGD